MRFHFEEKLKAYRKEVGGLAEEQDLEPATTRFTPRHFEWFALHEMGGLSDSKIAKKYDTEKKALDVSSIRWGRKTAAKLLEWRKSEA